MSYYYFIYIFNIFIFGKSISSSALFIIFLFVLYDNPKRLISIISLNKNEDNNDDDYLVEIKTLSSNEDENNELYIIVSIFLIIINLFFKKIN